MIIDTIKAAALYWLKEEKYTSLSEIAKTVW